MSAAAGVTQASWRRMWHELGASDDGEAVFRKLMACWSEPHRHYHTLQHLRECLDLLEPVRGEALHPAEIEAALWFHDAFYEPAQRDNEQRSADWARSALLAAGAATPVAERVHALVMSTRHQEPPSERDAQLLTDIDLAILGAAAERFDESDAQIRAEYAHVPPLQWREGRGHVLRSFLERPQIYCTPRFKTARESQARANLRRALDRLG